MRNAEITAHKDLGEAAQQAAGAMQSFAMSFHDQMNAWASAYVLRQMGHDELAAHYSRPAIGGEG